MGGMMIVKSNALIEAGHRLSLTEQRIVLTAISKIRRDEAPDLAAWYTVSAYELSELSGVSLSRAYHDLASAVESLWQREIVVKGGPNGLENTPKKTKVMKARWVQAVEYEPSESTVKMMFSAPIMPYLTALKEQFTKYELQYVAPMKSRFGPRLYELLMQWRKFGCKEVTVDSLQELWGTNYDRIYDFKRFVITPAINDANKHSDLKVTASYKKTGRKVTHVLFNFSEKALPKSRSSNVIEHTPAQTQAQPQAQAQPATDIKAGSIAARVAAMAAEKPKKVLKNQREMDKLGRTGESREQLVARLQQQGYKFTFNPFKPVCY